MKKEFLLLALAIVVIAGLSHAGKLEQQDAEIESALYARNGVLGQADRSAIRLAKLS